MARYSGRCTDFAAAKSKTLLKGERCYTKCSVDRRSYAPASMVRDAKVSEYGKQLRTKQFARRFYGVLEDSSVITKWRQNASVTGETCFACLSPV